MIKAFKQGLVDMSSHSGIVALLWSTNLVLAVTVVLPLFNWLSPLNWTTETDVVGDPLSLPLLLEVFNADGASVLAFVMNLVTWLAILTVVVNVFLSGGILATLIEKRPGPTRERFWNGAARFFPRFVVLLLLGAVAALAILIPLNIGMGSVTYALTERTRSPLFGLLGGVLQFAVSGLIVFMVVLCVHYARIHLIHQDVPVWQAFLRGTFFVIRNFLQTVGLGLGFAIIGLALTLLAVLARHAFGGLSWVAILAVLLVQQLAMFLRSGLRLGLAGAEIDLYQQARVVPAPTIEEQPLPAVESEIRTQLEEPPLVPIGESGAQEPDISPTTNDDPDERQQ